MKNSSETRACIERNELVGVCPKEFYETVKQRPMFVPLKKLPPEVVKIFVGCEDPSFYYNHGILSTIMVQAAIRTIITKEYCGGSTIPRQLVKNVYLTHEQIVRRKALESVIALYIEARSLLSKDEILELYLNLAEMAPRVYGIGAAADYHFAKSATAGVDDLRARLPKRFDGRTGQRVSA